MKTYITKTGQNIFDVCVTLYGSIEGLIDLLICNPSLQVTEYGPQELIGKPLSLDITLSRGVILNYNEGIELFPNVVGNLGKDHIANGEHVIDWPEHDILGVKGVVLQTGKTSKVIVQLYDEDASITIDWGDYSTPDTVQQNTDKHTFTHVYKSSGEHVVKISGDIRCELLDITGINGVLYPTNFIYAKKFKTVITNKKLNYLIHPIT